MTPDCDLVISIFWHPFDNIEVKILKPANFYRKVRCIFGEDQNQQTMQ